MLRITRERRGAAELRLAAEGRIVGEWVSLLQSELEAGGNASEVALDLSQVQYASADGLRVLRAAEARGTRLLGASLLLRVLLWGRES